MSIGNGRSNSFINFERCPGTAWLYIQELQRYQLDIKESEGFEWKVGR